MGFNSYSELAYAGKPMVALPLIIDQHYNAAAAVSKGIGRMLNKANITVEGVRSAVAEVLNDAK